MNLTGFLLKGPGRSDVTWRKAGGRGTQLAIEGDQILRWEILAKLT